MPHYRISIATNRSSLRLALAAALLLVTAASASADTLRIVVDRALVWNRPSGASVVVTQVSRGEVLEIVRKLDEWYEIVVPGRERRTGFVRASQIELIPGSGGVPGGSPGQAAPGAPQSPAPGRPPARAPRSFLNVGAGYRVGAEKFTRTSSAFEEDFAEAGSITADYGDGSGVEFDFMVGQRLGRQLGAAFGVSVYPRTASATVTAAVPHPFYFDQPREATFDDSGVAGQEVAINASIAWIRDLNPNRRLMIYGGPSFFKITQDVVTDLAVTSAYPFDEVEITRTVTEEREGFSVGFHVGADYSHFFNRSFGIGVQARFSHGPLEFDDDDVDETTGNAGAAQIGGGLRFRF